MHLALMMHRTVDELLDSMSYPEMLRWQEYMELFPHEPWRADVRSAQVCAILANVHRDHKQRHEPYEIADFMLFDRPRPKAKPVDTEAPAPAEGAKIAPETIAWLMAKSRATMKAKEY